MKIELCTLKGKGSSLTPQQEWVFTEVSALSEQNCSFLVFAVSISYQILRPSLFNYCLLQYFLAGELDQTNNVMTANILYLKMLYILYININNCSKVNGQVFIDII